ncbi:MAG: hypothetical protein F6K56_31440, partial [Moorea sp. SIO3G5]|nr:hypothetical protein [Moorena sp. SIO3G5]
SLTSTAIDTRAENGKENCISCIGAIAFSVAYGQSRSGSVRVAWPLALRASLFYGLVSNVVRQCNSFFATLMMKRVLFVEITSLRLAAADY